MSMREWLNNNSTLVASVAVVVLVVALGVVFFQQRGPGYGGASEVYFWDLEREEPFPHSVDVIPPIEAPSGGRGVRAHLYTCGECNPAEWFGYLETHTEEAKRIYEEEGVIPVDQDELLVRPLEGGNWTPLGRAMHVTDPVHDPCDPAEDDSFPEECLP